MNTLESEVRAALRRLVDERQRERLAQPTQLAPRRYTRCKTEAERRERLRRNWRESKRRAKAAA